MPRHNLTRKNNPRPTGLLRAVAIRHEEGGESVGIVPPPRFTKPSDLPEYLRTLREFAYMGTLIAWKRAKAAGAEHPTDTDFVAGLLCDLEGILDALATALETGTLEILNDWPDSIPALMQASAELVNCDDGSEPEALLPLLTESIQRAIRARDRERLEEMGAPAHWVEAR